MKLGIIGIGNMTLDFANRASMSGYEVLISHIRNNKVLDDAVERIGSNVKCVSINEMAKAEIIVLFIARDDIEALVRDLPDMTEKIILHTNNTIFNLALLESKSQKKSSYDILASLLPTSHVVKVFNVVEPMIILPHRDNNLKKNEIFYSAFNIHVINYVRIFLESLNFIGYDIVELNQFRTLN